MARMSSRLSMRTFVGKAPRFPFPEILKSCLHSGHANTLGLHLIVESCSSNEGKNYFDGRVEAMKGGSFA